MRFAERLRSEIEYACFNQKEFAAKAGIKKRALDAYLGVQQSMPPADTAVKIARALGVSVEYLVTGRKKRVSPELPRFNKPREARNVRDVVDDLQSLPDDIFTPVKAMIKAAANAEREKRAKQ